jgi:hypothetical protein
MMALFWSSKLGCCLVYRILIILISFQNDNEDLDVKRIKAEPDPIGSGKLIHFYSYNKLKRFVSNSKLFLSFF